MRTERGRAPRRGGIRRRAADTRDKRASLADLQDHFSGCRDRLALETLATRLRGDPRRGAQLISKKIRRKLDKLQREEERMRALFSLRRDLRRRGLSFIAGVDEAGMGPLAGPVVAAAVIFPDGVDLPGLDDSKRLTSESRENLAREIRAQALVFSIAAVKPEEIDRINIYQAGLQAMARAVGALAIRPQHVLVDARRIPELSCPQTPLVRGDSRDASIAAASILAKVHRDHEMKRLDRRFPNYGFAKHKGYPTPEHLAALSKHGPSSVHRRSFGPVAAVS